MADDIATTSELKAIEGSYSMVGLPLAAANKAASVFQICRFATAPPAPGQPDAAQSGTLTENILKQAVDDSEGFFLEYQKRQNYLGMFTTLSQQADLVGNKFVYSRNPSQTMLSPSSFMLKGFITRSYMLARLHKIIILLPGKCRRFNSTTLVTYMIEPPSGTAWRSISTT